MNTPAKPLELSLTTRRHGHFVQTDRASHEAWSKLTIRHPLAAALLHYFAAAVGENNAVVKSQKALAAALGVTDRSIRNALKPLVEGHWVQVVKLGAGRECAYVLNSRVVWSEHRDNLRFARFTATVIADADDQSPETLSGPELRRLPRLFDGEEQLPSGDGLPPPSQPFLDGMEPDLPVSGNPNEPQQ